MLPRSPTLATTTTICLMILTWICHFALAAEQNHVLSGSLHPANDTKPELTCSPFGTCEPCPEDALEEPFCMPFGNRRLMHCLNITSSAAPPPPSRQAGPPPQHPPDRVPAGQPPHHEQSQHPQGETLAWESCGRIVSQEVADFYEFVACNVLFAILALFVLFARSKRLQAMQARQLAARIGLIRGTGGRR